MKPPFVRDTYHPYRAPKSISALKRRRQRKQAGDDYMSLFDRVFYGVLTGLMYGFGGFLLDSTVTIIRSIMDLGDGSIYWLFAPCLAGLGVIVGVFTGKWAGADSIEVLHGNDALDLDDDPIRYVIFRGIGFGVFFFFLMWLAMALVL